MCVCVRVCVCVHACCSCVYFSFLLLLFLVHIAQQKMSGKFDRLTSEFKDQRKCICYLALPFATFHQERCVRYCLFHFSGRKAMYGKEK